MENTRFKLSQYACAVLLVVSSIALVSYQVIMIDDVSNGLLVYVAQAFLLVASIFGLRTACWSMSPRPSCSSPASSALTTMLNS